MPLISCPKCSHLATHSAHRARNRSCALCILSANLGRLRYQETKIGAPNCSLKCKLYEQACCIHVAASPPKSCHVGPAPHPAAGPALKRQVGEMASDAKIARVLARLEEALKEGNYYAALQMYRTVVKR
jgi:hypothetical protein